jgi:hypothetical protein
VQNLKEKSYSKNGMNDRGAERRHGEELGEETNKEEENGQERMIKDNNRLRRSWTTIRRYITQEQMRKNTVDKNNKEKYGKGVNVIRNETNRRIIRPQIRIKIHGRNNRIRGRRKRAYILQYRNSKGQALPTTCHNGI